MWLRTGCNSHPGGYPLRLAPLISGFRTEIADFTHAGLILGQSHP